MKVTVGSISTLALCSLLVNAEEAAVTDMAARYQAQVVEECKGRFL